MPSRNNSALHFSKRQLTLTSALKLTALIGINCALSSNVFADNENVSAANSSTTSHWSGYVSVTATSNVFRQSEPSSYQSISGNGRIGYRDTWGSIRLSVGGELETHHNTSYYYDSLLEYRTPVNNINENWSMLASAGLYLPTSHNSQKTNSTLRQGSPAMSFIGPVHSGASIYPPEFVITPINIKSVVKVSTLSSTASTCWPI